MSVGNPTFTQYGGGSWFAELQKDPDFQKLSPEAQQTLMEWGQKVDTGGQAAVQEFMQAIQSDPKLGQAVQEAKQVGATDHPMSPLMKALTIATVGVVSAGAALPFLGAGAAAAPEIGITSTTGSGVAAPTLSAAMTGIPSAAGGAAGAAAAAGPILSGAKKAADIAGKVQPILGGMADKGAEANAARDRNLINEEQVKLGRDKFALDAPGVRLGQSTRASILNTAQPSHIQWNGPGSGARGEIPTYTGGYAGALNTLDPQARATAQDVLHQNLTNQLAHTDANTPYLDQVGKTSVGDKAVGAGAMVAAALAALRKKQQGVA